MAPHREPPSRHPTRVEVVCEAAAPVDAAFRFLGDARNLNRLTPSWFRFDILTPQPIAMAAGTRIDYRLRWRGLRLRWQSLVTDWQPPELFVYEQGRGPYRFFRHEHRFEVSEAGTRISDCIDFASPAGSLVDRLLLAPELRRILIHRSLRIRQLSPAMSAEASLVGDPAAQAEIASTSDES